MMTLTPYPHVTTIAPFRSAVPIRWRSHQELTVDAQGISWGDSAMAFDDIESVAYATRSRLVNLVQRRVQRRVRLVAPGQALTIDLATAPFGPRHEHEHHAAFRAVVGALHAVVEPRLRGELLREIAAGNRVRIGPFTLGREGLEHDARAALPWDRLPMAVLDGEHVGIEAAAPRPADRSSRVPMISPNAVLLPELLDDCADAFA